MSKIFFVLSGVAIDKFSIETSKPMSFVEYNLISFSSKTKSVCLFI